MDKGRDTQFLDKRGLSSLRSQSLCVSIVQNNRFVITIALGIAVIEYLLSPTSINPLNDGLQKSEIVFHNAITLYHLALLVVFSASSAVLAWVFYCKWYQRAVISFSNLVALILIEDIFYFLIQLADKGQFITANDWTCLHLGCFSFVAIVPVWYPIAIGIVVGLNLLVHGYSYFKSYEEKVIL